MNGQEDHLAVTDYTQALGGPESNGAIENGHGIPIDHQSSSSSKNGSYVAMQAMEDLSLRMSKKVAQLTKVRVLKQ